MTVREALEKLATYRHSNEPPVLEIRIVAPKIEAALRAAYRKGVTDTMDDIGNTSNNGVTAGIEAMQ